MTASRSEHSNGSLNWSWLLNALSNLLSTCIYPIYQLKINVKKDPDFWEHVASPNYQLPVADGGHILTPQRTAERHLNRNALTEDENNDLDAHINARMENAVVNALQQRGDFPLTFHETRGLKDFDPAEGVEGLVRRQIESERDYFVGQAEEEWLHSHIGVASAPGQTAIEMNQPIDKRLLTEREQGDLEEYTNSAMDNIARKSFDDSYDPFDHDDTPADRSARAQAHAETQRGAIEQSWLKTPVGAASTPGKKHAELSHQEDQQWVKKTEKTAEKPSIEKNRSPTVGGVDRQHLSEIEKSHLDTYVENKMHSEAVKHFNNSYDSFDHDDTPADRSARAKAYAESQRGAIEQSWKKTAIGASSALGEANQATAEAKSNTNLPNLSSLSGTPPSPEEIFKQQENITTHGQEEPNISPEEQENKRINLN